MCALRVTTNGHNHYHNHYFKKQRTNNYNDSNYSIGSRALWLPWPPMAPYKKPFQILWMVAPPETVTTVAQPAQPVITQPPLIAEPPSQPLIIPSHVANALMLTR
jgi:hypothetical protein